MWCSDCGIDMDDMQLLTCDVCGKKCCPKCFREWHDGNRLELDLHTGGEKPVSAC